MKYSNRFGDQRSIFYRKGDNLKIGEKFYEIVGLRDIPQLPLDLGSVSAGSFSAPTQGTKVQFGELEPMNEDELVHVLIGVEETRFLVGPTASTSLPPPGGFGPDAEVQGYSCRILYWNPQEQPQWLSPHGNIQSFIDHRISPIGDENELFPVFVIKDNPPYFRADNPWDHGSISQHIFAIGKLYKLSDLGSQPEKFAVITGVPTKDLICGTSK